MHQLKLSLTVVCALHQTHYCFQDTTDFTSSLPTSHWSDWVASWFTNYHQRITADGCLISRKSLCPTASRTFTCSIKLVLWKILYIPYLTESYSTPRSVRTLSLNSMRNWGGRPFLSSHKCCRNEFGSPINFIWCSFATPPRINRIWYPS